MHTIATLFIFKTFVAYKISSILVFASIQENYNIILLKGPSKIEVLATVPDIVTIY